MAQPVDPRTDRQRRDEFQRFIRHTTWFLRLLLVLWLIGAVFVTIAQIRLGQQQDDLDDAVARVEAQQKAVAAQQAALVREGIERRHDTCTERETTQREDVVRLRRIYRYLLSLTAEERGERLNQEVAGQLAEAEREAREDDADAYCDEKDPYGNDVGLPEPDLKIPKRPAKLRGLP